jgi:hypothetical protein
VLDGRQTHLADLMHRAEGSNGTAIASNWILSTDGTKRVKWRPETTGGTPSLSYGSNANDVGNPSAPGASSLVTRADHVHRGVRSITANGSNNLFGNVNLKAGTGIALGVSGQDVTITNTGSSSGGGSGTNLTIEEVDGSPTVAATKLVLPNGTLGVVGTVATYTPTGGGSLTEAYVGYNTIGGSWETGAVNEWAIAKQIVLANDCLITNVDVYLQLGSAGTMAGPAAALYADSAGAPGQILYAPAERGGPIVSQPATTPLWFGCNGLGWVTAGTYWVVIRVLDTGGTVLVQVAYDGSGSDRTQDFTANAWQTWSAAAGTRKYSIRAKTIR